MAVCAVSLLVLTLILSIPSETVYIKESDPTPQAEDDPSIPTAPEPQILATTTTATTTEPEPIKELPQGVNCLADCPLIQNLNNLVEKVVRLTFHDKPLLIAIARCESTFRQWDPKTGEPLSNPGSSATGAMQLMASYHREPASNLGWDIDTLQGNLAYGEYLYDTEGVTPWEASRYCWEGATVTLNKDISDILSYSPTLSPVL